MMFPDMADVHLKEETIKGLGKGSRREVFDNLVLGVNLLSFDCIERVGQAVLRIPEEELETITRPVFVKRFLNGIDFLDLSDYLV